MAGVFINSLDQTVTTCELEVPEKSENLVTFAQWRIGPVIISRIFNFKQRGDLKVFLQVKRGLLNECNVSKRRCSYNFLMEQLIENVFIEGTESTRSMKIIVLSSFSTA